VAQSSLICSGNYKNRRRRTVLLLCIRSPGRWEAHVFVSCISVHELSLPGQGSMIATMRRLLTRSGLQFITDGFQLEEADQNRFANSGLCVGSNSSWKASKSRTIEKHSEWNDYDCSTGACKKSLVIHVVVLNIRRDEQLDGYPLKTVQAYVALLTDL
jgi:hypothetical protein